VARESIELAFVAALQHLPARQRAVLLLREVLDYSAAETADLLDTTVAAVNSTLQRARRTRDEHLAGDTSGRTGPGTDTHADTDTDTDTGTIRTVARRYAAAWEAGDVDAVVALLTDDIAYSMPPLPEYYVGRDPVRAFLVDGPLRSRWRFLPARANGALAFGTFLWDEAEQAYLPGGLDLLRLRAGLVAEVISFLDADFAAFGLPLRLAPTDEGSSTAAR